MSFYYYIIVWEFTVIRLIRFLVNPYQFSGGVKIPTWPSKALSFVHALFWTGKSMIIDYKPIKLVSYGLYWSSWGTQNYPNIEEE